MVALVAALIALALAANAGGDSNSADGEIRPAPSQTAAAGSAQLIPAPERFSDIDILQQRGITPLSRGDLPVAEPVSFLGDSENDIPAPLCVHWKVFRHNAVTNGAEVVAEFFESCDEETTTSQESVPERLVRLENSALREQLSFIVSQLSWDEYLTISEQYAHARLARSLEIFAEQQGSP